ncbi:MAG: glycosyl transferase [Proteobacteria bacterium]|nr:glycosyl transferase [Pseudomonadota bacterium]
MAEIAYILLCHKDPAGIVRQAERLTAAGDCVAIHFDRRAAAKDYRAIRQALDANPRVAFARRRVRCGWGEWSLVAASLMAVRAAVAAFPEATHFYMLSGDCMPVKTAEFARAYLDREDCDHIESFDFFDSDWIRTGIKEERLIYRHFFNERGRKWLFYSSLSLQRRLGLARAVPADLQVMIGSQWWCLRRRTIEKVLAFCDARPDVVRFFRTTWIPDETFFQTIVRHLVPGREIRSRSLTFLMFTDYGMPATFYNDHYDYLLSQDFLFARKVSAQAGELKERLGRLYGQTGVDFDIAGDGRRLMGFLTGRGRHGRRFAPRFWEAEATMGRDRTLYIVACKKWHVAKRLVQAIRANSDIPAVEYLFSEETAGLPDLGGIQSSLAKRTRHRRSLVRMLYEHFGSDRLAICLDTSEFELIRDFYADRAQVRLLEVACDFSDDYLIGHAQRVGLAGADLSAGATDRLLPTIRFDVRFESDRIRDAGLPGLFRLRQSATLDENARELAGFLGLTPDAARAIAGADHLFSD